MRIGTSYVAMVNRVIEADCGDEWWATVNHGWSSLIIADSIWLQQKPKKHLVSICAIFLINWLIHSFYWNKHETKLTYQVTFGCLSSGHKEPAESGPQFTPVLITKQLQRYFGVASLISWWLTRIAMINGYQWGHQWILMVVACWLNDVGVTEETDPFGEYWWSWWLFSPRNTPSYPSYGQPWIHIHSYSWCYFRGWSLANNLWGIYYSNHHG